MKKLLLFAMIAMLLVTPIIATSEEENKCDTNWFCNQELTAECADFYGSQNYYTIATWTYDGNNYVITEQNNLYRYYNINLNGNLNSADWTANPNVKSVLVNAGNEKVEFKGGASGSVNSVNNINNVVFCGYKNGGGSSKSATINDNSNGVPEFPALTVGVAVLVVTLGLVFIRKN